LVVDEVAFFVALVVAFFVAAGAGEVAACVLAGAGVDVVALEVVDVEADVFIPPATDELDPN
jgi:hypothetical protein